MLPTSQSAELWQTPAFWFGLFYICFPLNFMVYGWNDRVDMASDAINPRKDSFWFGARGSESQLNTLWKPIFFVQLACLPFLVYFGGFKILLVYGLFLLINYLYNLPEQGLRSKPPFELLCQVGYLLVVPMSMFINDTASPPWQTFFYLFLFSMQSHLMGEVMDHDPDLASNKTTTATKIGIRKTKLLIIGIMILEISILFFNFKEFIFGGVLALGLLWLILDVFVIFRTRKYSNAQMKLFAFASNGIAFITISYVWYSGCLLEVKQTIASCF